MTVIVAPYISSSYYFTTTTATAATATATATATTTTTTTTVTFVTAAADDANDPVYGKLTTSRDRSFGGSSCGLQKTSRAQVVSGLTDQETVRSKSSSAQPHSVIYPCAACEGSHKIFQCERFRNMKPEERCRLPREKGLCFNCLRVAHRAEACKLARNCSVQGCNNKHSRYLH